MFENRAHWADKAFWWIAPVVIVAAAAGGLYYYYQSRHKNVVDVPLSAEPAPVAREAEPAIKHPIPKTATPPDETQRLPSLEESDSPLQDALAKVFDSAAIQKALVPDGLVRRIVATVDNIPRQKVAIEKRPLKPLEGQTAVDTEGDLVTLSESNYARYQPMVRMIEGVSPQQLGDLYFRFYPLFQQSYEDLGYPGQYFNDRVVEAIDSLLAAPEPAGRIQLVQPRVFYEFADPKLEALPAGQKLMVRMGAANSKAVKAKLRELRRIVTTGRDPPADTGSEDTASPAPPRSGIISTPGGMHHWL